MKLTSTFLEKYKNEPPKWGFGALGWVVYARTYSRPLPEGGMESWWQTVQRVVEGVYEVQKTHCDKNGLPWSGHKAQLSAQRMYDLIFNFKMLPPGRGLWAMGTEYVRNRGSAALNNCAFISTIDIKKDFSYPFCFLMDMSMLGVGVGGDTRGEGTIGIVEPEQGTDEYVVEDSREGWVGSVRVILESFVGRASYPKSFNYSSVRPSGSPIRGFGGVSSGPGPLQDLHVGLVHTLRANIGKQITSTTIVDIFNLIGRAVVAGGIRRTAEIMLGDANDEAFLKLKDPKLYAQELKSHRWASNNSIIASVGIDYNRFVPQIMENGEPGFFWLENARSYRRMKDGYGYWDPHVVGQNPCGEISLESGEFCNLVEIYPAFHDSYEEFEMTLKSAYLYAKSVSLMPTHNLTTNSIVGRNRRIGISVSGVTQAMSRHGARTFFDWLDKGYTYVRDFLDPTYSRWLCVPTSIKLTTVKPSGTISLLAGATPGVHAPHAEYYLRNVRFDPHSPLLPILEAAGYPVEKSLYADNTHVVGFPVREPFFSKSKADVSVWEQLELAAQMQYYWADNSVSVTVTVKQEEEKDLARALSYYETRLKSVSLIPLHDHGYEQAPYIEINQDQYEKLMSKIALVSEPTTSAHDVEERGCTTDSCSII